MKQPVFIYEGEAFLVKVLQFTDDGKLAHICIDYKGKFETVFSKYSTDEEGIDKDGFFHANLDECVKTDYKEVESCLKIQ